MCAHECSSSARSVSILIRLRAAVHSAPLSDCVKRVKALTLGPRGHKNLDYFKQFQQISFHLDCNLYRTAVVVILPRSSTRYTPVRGAATVFVFKYQTVSHSAFDAKSSLEYSRIKTSSFSCSILTDFYVVWKKETSNQNKTYSYVLLNISRSSFIHTTLSDFLVRTHRYK